MAQLKETIRHLAKEAENLNLKFNIIDEKETSEIWKNLINRFARNSSYRYPLWENIQYEFCVEVDSDFWKRVGGEIKLQEYYLLIEPTDSKISLHAYDSSKLSELLGEMYEFEYYVADMELTKLWCYSSHDIFMLAKPNTPYKAI